MASMQSVTSAHGFAVAMLLLIRTVAALLSSAPLPDPEIAASAINAFRIFNAVHSVLRQWGSSLNHNGLSFVPVTIPEGNVFYHGTRTRNRPSGFEWLAFEIEHASNFAQSLEGWAPRPGQPPNATALDQPGSWSLHGHVGSAEHSHRVLSRSDQYFLRGSDDDDGDDRRRPRPAPFWGRGYLQTYRAARPLNLVYIDGMAAAKCLLGSLDSQDYLLLDWPIDTARSIGGEWDRANDLCSLAQAWAIDGWIRMEAGFEIIYCNFSRGGGLDLLSVRGSPWPNETDSVSRNHTGRRAGEWATMGRMEWMRAAAARYHGLPRGRATVDFSSMVSAFAYPVNTTNPDLSRPELPRIVNATRAERNGIRDRLHEVVRARAGRPAPTVDWQTVVDDIVARYADRLWFITTEPARSAGVLRSELATLLFPFLNFPADADYAGPGDLADDENSPVHRCAEHPLRLVAAHIADFTPEDRAVHAAVAAVSRDVCAALFEMRQVAHASDGSEAAEKAAAERTRTIATSLMSRLGWSTWKDCGKCPDPEQLCFVAMFPFGTNEDHFSPRCKSASSLQMGYFSGGRRGPGHGGPP